MHRRFCNLILFIIFLLFSSLSIATTAKKNSPLLQPEIIKVGMYITQLYDLNLTMKSFNTVFWAWFIHHNPHLNPAQATDITNARNFHIDATQTSQIGPNLYWSSAKFSAHIIKHWDLTLFPFDTQTLDIYLESSDFDTNKLLYVPDTANSKVDTDIDLGDWIIKNFTITANQKTYPTSYGDPTTKAQSAYSRVIATITIERKGLRKFIQYLGVGYIACFIGFCIYLIPTTDFAPKITLLGGSIFAAVGNKIVLDNFLPALSMITLVDKIQILIFTFLCYTLVATVISAIAFRHWHKELADKINLLSFLVALIAMPSINAYLLVPIWLH